MTALLLRCVVPCSHSNLTRAVAAFGLKEEDVHDGGSLGARVAHVKGNALGVLPAGCHHWWA